MRWGRWQVGASHTRPRRRCSLRLVGCPLIVVPPLSAAYGDGRGARELSTPVAAVVIGVASEPRDAAPVVHTLGRVVGERVRLPVHVVNRRVGTAHLHAAWRWVPTWRCVW